MTTVSPHTRAAPEQADGDLPLAQAAKNTPTSLWLDSADPVELEHALTYGIVGATCNPVIAFGVVQRHLDVWGPFLGRLAAERPQATETELGWRTVEELSVQSARLLLPVFERTGGRDGRLSIQTDPRLHRDAGAIVEQAVRFSRLAENIIVKIPATAAGVRAAEEATYRGVSVNATVSFSVPQALAMAEAVERGIQRRLDEGQPDREFGSVITIMGGRLDDWLKAYAERHRLLADPGHLEWAGVAVIKRAYQLFRERGYRSRVLAGAFRNRFLFTELVGGDLVITINYDWQQRLNDGGAAVDPAAIDRPVVPAIIAGLAELPDFVRAYEPDGLAVADFDGYAPSRRTLREFLDADAKLDELVRDVLVPAP